ncbi:MAG: hypothetical protein R6V83_10045 [Candidatus Thorarchaeota archaeon]
MSKSTSPQSDTNPIGTVTIELAKGSLPLYIQSAGVVLQHTLS